jgi:hypothetical protein
MPPPAPRSLYLQLLQVVSLHVSDVPEPVVDEAMLLLLHCRQHTSAPHVCRPRSHT